jgi:cytochrome bd-type quinol oxidase subunit 2
MSKSLFPWIASAIGLVLLAVLLLSGAASAEAEGSLPLLTQLMISEFGFILALIGTVMGIRQQQAEGTDSRLMLATLACGLFALVFAGLGVSLWPGQLPG